MGEPNENTAGRARRASAPPALIAAGFAIFLAGALLPLLLGSHTWLLAIRWSGIAILALAALRKPSLTFWILIAMLAGFEIGLDRPHFAENLRFLSDIFLRLIRLIVAPLILGTLITGIASHGDLRGVGRIGIKSLVYFEIVTTIALFIGLGAINLTRAGEGLVIPEATQAAAAASQTTAPVRWQDFVLHIFPDNIVKAAGDNQILQVAVFAIIFGIALTLVSEKKREPLVKLAESLTQAMFAFTNIVMYYAPIGVGAAMAYTIGHVGLGALLPLAKLLGTAYAALLAFLLLVFLPITQIFRIPLKRFILAVAEPAAIAFATSTSEAALPRAMEAMEEFGVPRRIVAFVIPAGYSFNLDGSTLYLALASVFVAQAAGMHMTLGQQLYMVLMLMLTSKGVAGVPRAALVVLMATASMFHLPVEPIFLILGIDALIDMIRTSVNVTGNCLACAVIARSEGELPPAGAVPSA
ncbi:MAG TPA: cation:dicarboxylase symporter family transporter [Terriglobales bacterium]|nr:cation:dicarboxylase symporter family transporter [Terriglobales bacterium]